jgi:hypothetical protein
VAWRGDGRRSLDGASRAEELNQSYVLDTGVLLNLVRGKELGSRIDREFGLSRAMRLHTISIVTHGELKVLAERHEWGAEKRSAAVRFRSRGGRRLFDPGLGSHPWLPGSQTRHTLLAKLKKCLDKHPAERCRMSETFKTFCPAPSQTETIRTVPGLPGEEVLCPLAGWFLLESPSAA